MFDIDIMQLNVIKLSKNMLVDHMPEKYIKLMN